MPELYQNWTANGYAYAYGGPRAGTWWFMNWNLWQRRDKQPVIDRFTILRARQGRVEMVISELSEDSYVKTDQGLQLALQGLGKIVHKGQTQNALVEALFEDHGCGHGFIRFDVLLEDGSLWARMESESSTVYLKRPERK